MSKKRKYDPFGGEYSAVGWRISWGGLSLAMVLIMIFTRELLSLLPLRRLIPLPWPLAYTFSVAILAAVGFVSGLLGLRSSEQKTASRIGTLLNGIALVLVGLALFGMYWVRYLR